MNLAIAYLRVSTRDQGDNGIGLNLQETQVRAFADAEGFRLVEVYRDIQSGMGDHGLDCRPTLQKAFHRAQELGAVVMVSSIDRLTRNTNTMQQIIAAENATVIDTNNGNSQGAIQIAAAARAQHQGEEISRRTREALQALKAQGVQLGNRTNLPEARKKANQARRNQSAQRVEALRPVVDAIIAPIGHISIREIGRELDKRGIRPVRGQTWNPASVKRLLDRLYCLESVEASETYQTAPIHGMS